MGFELGGGAGEGAGKRQASGCNGAAQSLWGLQCWGGENEAAALLLAALYPDVSRRDSFGLYAGWRGLRGDMERWGPGEGVPTDARNECGGHACSSLLELPLPLV